MPKVVDRDAHRRQMAETAAELVGVHGLVALTFRNVAEAAGSSTTALTHYFADKDDLMLCTFEVVAQRYGARFDAARAKGGGLAACLESLLPLDRRRQTDQRLLTCYFGFAVSNPALADAQARHVRSAQKRIERILAEDHPGWTPVQAEVAARRLGALVHGLSTHHALDPKHWSAATQRRVLADELATLVSDQTARMR